MKKMIFYIGCMISGLLICLIMVLLSSQPNVFGTLNTFGKCIMFAGILLSLYGFACAIIELNKED